MHCILLHTISAACDQFLFFFVQQGDTNVILHADSPDDDVKIKPETDASGNVVASLIAFIMKDLHYTSRLLCFSPAKWPF